MDNLEVIEWHNDPLSADLGVIELDKVPFPVRRVYWISRFKEETVRGNHAHKKLTQLMIPLLGSLDVILFTGTHSVEIRLSAGDEPILIKPGVWRVMKKASEDALVMVLASEKFDESDYIRDWHQYLAWYEATE